MRRTHWSLQEIRDHTTRRILRKLNRLGIPIEREQFRQDVRRFNSAQQLSEEWYATYETSAEGFDIDFIWMAAIVLWERLCPHVMNDERLDDMIRQGYDHLRLRRTAAACTLWLKVWEHLKSWFPSEVQSISQGISKF